LAKPLPPIEWIAPHIVTLCCYHFFKLGRRKECWKKQTIILLPPLQRPTIFNSHENKQTNKQTGNCFCTRSESYNFCTTTSRSPQPPQVLDDDQVCALSVCAT
jgi:hypothetical protein